MSEQLNKTIESVDPGKLETMKADLSSRHIAAANKFEAGLDKVTDVLLILVLKFGRATTMLFAMSIVLVFCLVTLVVATIHVTELRSEVRDLLIQQEEFAKSQKRLEKTTTETKQNVVETQAKVDDVVETAPKVEVDAKTGKAKLVVSGPEEDIEVELK